MLVVLGTRDRPFSTGFMKVNEIRFSVAVNVMVYSLTLLKALY